ncbi:melanopsin-A-like [Saccostrea echinata]|uniref:melanopsin-A-like n=1 Tax=Saccostrea echinata TaxID=191078 RepID=UPI002A836DEC|nr:melanopsin-A-like [Saccostrea echinata]
MDSNIANGHNMSGIGVNSPSVQNVIYGFLLILVSAFIITINGLLLFVIWSTKYLHRCQNVFVVSLAISDILSGFVEGPFLAYVILNRPDKFHACPVEFFVNHFTKSSFSFSLMMLSLERCLAVSRPLKYQSLVTDRSCTISVVLIWMLSALFASVPLFRNRFIYDKHNHKCSFESHAYGYTKNTIIVYIVLSRFLPMFVILVCVMVTLNKARSRFKFTASILAAVPFTVTPVVYPLNLKKITLKALRSLLHLSIAFSVLTIVCCTSGIQKIVQNLDFPPEYEMALQFISLSYYFITPVIILIFNKQYQNRIVFLICKRGWRTSRVGQDPLPTLNYIFWHHYILFVALVITFFSPKLGQEK